MIVIEKEDGKTIVRPAYIGFIKNNAIRRALMILLAPLIIALTLALNVLLALLKCLISFVLDIKNLKKGVMKYWDKPRRKQ